MNRSSLSDPRSSLSYGHFPSQVEGRDDASAPARVGSKSVHLDHPLGKRAEVAKQPEIHPQGKFPLPMRENTPAPVAKPETKFQKGMAESEVVVGDLFQALKHTAGHPVDGYEVSRLCGALTKTLEKNVEGHMHETVTGKYALRAVEGMTKDELLSVQRGFETLNLRDENVANIMRYVTGQLRALEVDPELAGLVKKIALVGKYDDPVKIGPIYNQMMLTAGQLLAGKGKQSTPDLQRAFVMNAIDKMLQSGELSVTAAKGFISQLPTEEQRAIVKDGAAPRDERLVKRMAPAVACSIAGICLWAKKDVLAKSPAHFANAVIKNEEYLRKDGGRRQRPEVYEAHQELLRSEVDSLLTQNSLPVEALADEQLRELDGALGRLGIPHGRSEIMAEILRRDGHAPLPANGSKPLTKVRLADRMMNAMTHSSMRTEVKVRMGREETNRKVAALLTVLSKPEDRSTLLTNRGTVHAITESFGKAMEPMTSRGHSFDAEFLTSLQSTMGRMSRDELIALNRELANNIIELDLGVKYSGPILAALKTELHSRLVASAERALAPLKNAAREAMRGTGPEVTRTVYRDMMTRAGVLLKAHGQPHHDEAASRELVMDMLARAVEDGSISPVEVKALIVQLPAQEQQAITALGRRARVGIASNAAQSFVSQELQKVIAGDATGHVTPGPGLKGNTEANALTYNTKQQQMLQRIAARGLSGVVHDLMRSTDSPIRMGGSAAGFRTVGLSTDEKFTVAESTVEGASMVVHYTCEISRASELRTTKDGRETRSKLPLGGSAKFTQSFTVAADGTVTMTEPLHYQYNARTNPWTKGYVPSEKLADYFEPGAEEMLSDLIAYAQSKYEAESLNFLVALREFNSDTEDTPENPANARAEAFAQRFLRDPADADCVNLSDPLMKPFVGDLRDTPRTHAQLSALFSLAEKEVGLVASNNNVKKFVKAARDGELPMNVRAGARAKVQPAATVPEPVTAPVTKAMPTLEDTAADVLGLLVSDPAGSQAQADYFASNGPALIAEVADIFSRWQDRPEDLANPETVAREVITVLRQKSAAALQTATSLFEAETSKKPFNAAAVATAAVAAAGHLGVWQTLKGALGVTPTEDENQEVALAVDVVRTGLAADKFPFEQLSDSELAQLMAALVKGGVNTGGATAEVTARRERSAEAFVGGVAAVQTQTGARTANPAAFAKTLIEATRFLAAYEGYNVVLGANPSLESSQNVVLASIELRSDLQKSLSPGKFPFHELNDSDLGQLADSLFTLGMTDSPANEALSAEILSRIAKTVNKATTAAGFVKAMTVVAAGAGVSGLSKRALWSVIGERIHSPSGAKAVRLKSLNLEQLNELARAINAMGLAELAPGVGNEFDVRRKGALKGMIATVQDVRTAIETVDGTGTPLAMARVKDDGKALERALLSAAKHLKTYHIYADSNVAIPEELRLATKEVRAMIFALDQPENAQWLTLVGRNGFLLKAIEFLGFSQEPAAVADDAAAAANRQAGPVTPQKKPPELPDDAADYGTMAIPTPNKDVVADSFAGRNLKF